MEHEAWSSFRLVGGTALSLQLGHRMSIDLDLFTDLPYGSVDFDLLDRSMEVLFQATDFNRTNPPGLGKTYYFEWNGCAIKVDAFYTDPFLEPAELFGFLRLAGLRDLAAMKMDVLQRGGRKKDFWDIHALHNQFSLDELFDAHRARYPFVHDPKLLRSMLTQFETAEFDFEPYCYLGKHRELIKYDFEQWSASWINPTD